MTFINYAAREINCKIVYYGPGLGGKTTNIKYVYEKTNPNSKGKLISLATETDRTLFFDFLPLNKRDLPAALRVEEMRRQLVRKGEPVFDAVAAKGNGVFETLKTIAKMVLIELRKGR